MDKLKVVIVEPLKQPYAKEIDNTIDEIQSIVNGNVETAPLYLDINGKEHFLLIALNDEGKFNGCVPNRRYYGGDVIHGTFLVTAFDGRDDFRSLTDEETEAVMKFYETDCAVGDFYSAAKAINPQRNIFTGNLKETIIQASSEGMYNALHIKEDEDVDAVLDLLYGLRILGIMDEPIATQIINAIESKCISVMILSP